MTGVPAAAIVAVLERAAARIGAQLLVEPEWGCVGQVLYPSGVRRYFKLSTLDLNTMGASEIARDKGYARFFLKSMGYPVAEGRTFLSPRWARELKTAGRGIDEAWQYARTLGLPVFVKPNALSRGVAVAKVHNRRDFYWAAREAARRDKAFLVEAALTGQDYRFVVLDGETISAYERVRLGVTGDGVSTMRDLLTAKAAKFQSEGRLETIVPADRRIVSNLKRRNMTLETILPPDVSIPLLDNANLSAGGTSIDVTQIVHPDYRDLAARIAHDMGLRLVGVDLMINGSITDPPANGSYWVIEVNSAPGLDHYAAMGDTQQGIVDDLYFRVLRAMERPQERAILSTARPA